jgi:replicative DNA helicase
MTRPIYDIEAALQEEARPAIIEAEVAKEAAEARAESIMTKARKADDALASSSLVAEAAGLRMEADAIVVPPKPRLTASGDVTPETLTKLLAAHGRIGVLSPEGDLFDIIAGRYSKQPNLGVFLQGHKGERLQTERITRDADLSEKPALTIGITLQPPVLMDLAQTPVPAAEAFWPASSSPSPPQHSAIARWLFRPSRRRRPAPTTRGSPPSCTP